MDAKVNPVSYVEQWKIDKAKKQAEQQKATEQKAEKPAKKNKVDEE